MAAYVYWLIASGTFLLLEAFGIPGVGFFFAAFGAILVAAAIGLGFVAEDATLMQCALFAIFTTLTAALLWRRLKRWRLNPGAPLYSNIVGTEAVVHGDGLSGEHTGEVRWSGTTMRARLADPADTLPAGTDVRITALDGNTLIVTRK